ncbi:hypothetical protein PTD2_17157 [Pseudoalteromonas tunicata D2]|uniref:Uncharacterized protein n=1 Tax=Pseudoalteromonas tunicata D2 TaxID=87626 RepID=A4CF14_9GAMM|nr:hypothetical protein PTD2_17157 [Pseudoalteromonas tunicata D2]
MAQTILQRMLSVSGGFDFARNMLLDQNLDIKKDVAVQHLPSGRVI